ncbi:MAG: crotonase [Phototrophicales bacterium]|nr:MAG: crotonase [Phototrophicales bacterium]RMG75466.1 MAG: enoyl-CoA hydratase/isomerase family protein [Chloroflexota bacterium]
MINEIEYTQDTNGIVTIQFNRPTALNALNLAAMQQFATLITQLQTNTNIRAVILTGAGQEAFCSGGDLFELSRYPSEEDARRFIILMGDALLQLEKLPIPVIAAINGYALGGGSEIAVACDMRIVDERVRMGFVQIRLALTPGWGAGQRLMRLVGYSKAMDLLLRGHIIRADELLTLGLANKVVEAGTAYDHALHFAKHIADLPPDVVRGIKALLRAGLGQPYEQALQTEREIFPPLWAAEPHLKAVDDFLKRQQDKK